jgi:hypothetical protein
MEFVPLRDFLPSDQLRDADFLEECGSSSFDFSNQCGPL